MYIVVVLVDLKLMIKMKSAPISDSKLMYQVISSAIVNLPPPRMAIYACCSFVENKMVSN